MEAIEALATQVLAAVNADSGGLAGSGATSFLRQVIRSEDSQALSLNDRPALQIDCSSSARSPVTTNTEHYEGAVTFIVYAARDPGRGGIGTLDDVMARLKTVFENKTLSSLSDGDDSGRTWYFAPMWRAVMGPPTANTDTIRQPVTYRVYFTKGTA